MFSLKVTLHKRQKMFFRKDQICVILFGRDWETWKANNKRFHSQQDRFKTCFETCGTIPLGFKITHSKSKTQ